MFAHAKSLSRLVRRRASLGRFEMKCGRTASVWAPASLYTSLKRFEPADLAVAYNFVKRRLVYFSLPGIQCLVDKFISRSCEAQPPHRGRIVSRRKAYEVWKDSKGAAAFDRRLRKVLFVGLSDGSRIDLLRRSNFSRISQEQVVPMMNVDIEKWRGLSDNLARLPIAPEQAVKMEPAT